MRDLANVTDFVTKRIDFERGQVALEAARDRIKSLSSSTPAVWRYEPMDYFAKEFYDLKEETVIGEMQVLKR